MIAVVQKQKHVTSYRERK